MLRWGMPTSERPPRIDDPPEVKPGVAHARAQGAPPVASQPSAYSLPQDPLAGKRILLVEDDPYIILALEEVMSECGLVVACVARDVRGALDFLAHDDVDLALLDVNVGRDKIDPVARTLSHRGRPFVLTSGYSSEEILEAYAGQTVVEKPFFGWELLQALRRVLSSSSPMGPD